MTRTTKQEFFGFFRQRLTNLNQIKDLEPSVKIRVEAIFNPELNVLLSVALDALAKYWAIYHNHHHRNAETRLGEFLARHGGAAWSQCSHLNLMRRAKAEATKVSLGRRPKSGELADPILQKTQISAILQKKLPPLVCTPAYITWDYDLSFESLSHDVEMLAAKVPAEWLRRSRYGEILYRHYRNGWIHAFNPDLELHVDDHMIVDPDHSPHYLWRNNRRVLTIPTEFILVSFDRALTQFEAEIPDNAQILI
jgi:hypothetical protein